MKEVDTVGNLDIERRFLSRTGTGSQWEYDANSQLSSGALNATSDEHARNPVLATINNTVYCAWIETRNSGDYNTIIVKHLNNSGSKKEGQWVQDGTEFSVSTGRGSRIINLDLASVNGIPHVAWTEWTHKSLSSGSLQNDPGRIQVYKLIDDTWMPVGGTLNVSSQNYVTYVDLAAHGSTPYVAWQERSSTGNNQIYVKHWNGSTWTADGGSLNMNAAAGEAGRPALASDGSRVWLAWTEGSLGQKSQLYLRSLTGTIWSAPEGSLNADPSNGSSSHPAIAISNGAPQVVWAERHFPSNTKQVYVKGRDDEGKSHSETLIPFGSNGPTVSIPLNTWTPLTPSGLAIGSSGVGNEGFSTFTYDPGIKKAVVFGKYHAVGTTSGEDQNALLAYDFQTNRWDLLEITETAWSEDLPGVGHDAGNIAIDTLRGLYITKGNLTLNNRTGWHTYVYDLKAGRGKRLMPSTESPLQGQSASAFTPKHDFILSHGLGSKTSWLYDYKNNTWSPASIGPSARAYPGMVYDSRNDLFVLFGGKIGTVNSNETWVFNPVSRTWTQRFPSVSPAGSTPLCS